MNIGNKRYVAVVLTVLIVGIISGFIYYNENINDNKRSYNEYYYELVLENDNQTTIFWPLPYDADLEGEDSFGNYSNLIEDLEITQGEGSITINKTKYGKALEIKFEGDVKIEGKKKIYSQDDKNFDKRDKYFFDDLSMRNSTGTTKDLYHVYSSTSDVDVIDFDCGYTTYREYDSVGVISKTTEDLKLDKGWQTVEL